MDYITQACYYTDIDLTVFTRVQVDPVYKSTPILEPKNKFFLFLGENFLEKLISYLGTLFQARYSYTKKITPSLDVKFIILYILRFSRQNSMK